MLRMQQTGVIVTVHASLGVELLADHASPLAAGADREEPCHGLPLSLAWGDLIQAAKPPSTAIDAPVM